MLSLSHSRTHRGFFNEGNHAKYPNYLSPNSQHPKKKKMNEEKKLRKIAFKCDIRLFIGICSETMCVREEERRRERKEERSSNGRERERVMCCFIAARWISNGFRYN